MLLNLLVETLSYHFYVSGLYASLDLSADCSEVLSDAYSNILHIIGCELPGKILEDGVSGGSTVGISCGNSFRALLVEHVEDVVAMYRDCPDDCHRCFEVLVIAFYKVSEAAGIHDAERGEHHRNAEESPGQTV